MTRLKNWRSLRPHHFLLALLLVFSAAPAPLDAGEKYLEFLQALRRRGYSDVALYYARQLRARASELPPQVQSQLDLEFAEVLVEAARAAPPEESEKLLDEAVAVLEAYAEKHRGTAEALEARLQLGILQMERGVNLAARARAADDDSSLQEARRQLRAARQTFAQLGAEGRELLRKATATRRRRTDEEALRLKALVQYARLNEGLTIYHEALTYDPRQKQRAALLIQAAELFDSIYQANRLELTVPVLYAHLWHGRCLQELGQLQDAIDIYDEVLVAEPPSDANLDEAEADLFTRAYLFRLECMEKLGKLQDIVNHDVYGAEQWLRSHQALRGTPGYAQVQALLARTYVALARQEQNKTQRDRLLRRAIELLQDAVAVAGPHQGDALRLLNSLQVEVRGSAAQPRRWDEAVAIGDLALDTRDWKKAIEAYELALRLPATGIDPAEKAAVRYRLAYAYYQSGNAATAAKLARQVLQEAPQSPVALDAAALAIYGQYALLRAARAPADRETHFQTLQALANQILALWPDKPVADMARYFLGLAYWQRQEYARAAEMLSQVSAEFPDYATSRLYAAQALWYDAAQRRTEGSPIEQATLTQILQLLHEAVEASRETNPQTAGEALLLQAQILLQAQQPAQAKDAVVRAIEALRGSMSAEAAALRVRGYTLGLQLASATRDSELLRKLVDEIATAVESGSETVDPNVLAFVVGQLAKEYREAESDTQREQTFRTLETLINVFDTASVKDPRVLANLAEGYFILATHTGDTERYRTASLLYERLLEQTESDRTKLFYRLRLAACHRSLKNYEAAYEQLQQLIAAYGGPTKAPVSIQMELARTLYEWAQEEPSKMAEAARAWGQVVELLARRRPRPREYYEAQYYLALALEAIGQRSEARTLVQRVLRLSPSCGGPDLKQKFQNLLARLEGAGTSR